MNNHLTIAILSFISILGLPLFAQELPSEEVEVIKSFDARLANAERLEVNPQLPGFDTTTLDYDFSVEERMVAHSYSPPALRALGVPRPPDEDVYNTYVRAGYGLPSSPLFDAQYAYNNEKNFSFLLDAQHYSINNSTNLEHQFIMENDVHAKTKVIASDAFAINGFVDYSLDRYDLYGYDHAVDSFSDFAAERRFNTFSIGAGIENPAPTSSNIDYQASLFYRNHKDNRAATENTIGFEGKITKWFREKNPLSLEVGGQSATFNDTLDKKLNTFFATPTFSFYKENWSAKIGMQYATGAGRNYFYPELLLQARVVGSKAIAYLGSNGSLEQQNFFRLSQYNPYIASQIDSLLNTSTLNIYGGVKGKVNNLYYQGQISYSLVDNLRLFEVSSDDERFFKPIYDNGDILGVDISLGYQPLDKLDVNAGLSYKMYSMDSLENAWYLPSFRADLNTQYKLFNDNLTVWLDVFYQNGVPVPDENGELVRLDGLMDVSVGVDYYFSKYFGIFINGYNLTNNNGQRWARYPSIGTNIVGGVVLKF